MNAVKFLFPLALLIGGVGNASAQTTHQIDLVGTVFSPADIVIDQGDTVVWNWVSGFHNVVSNEDMWSSGAPTTGPHTFSITFDEAFMKAHPANGNVYGFHCEVHEALGMFGSVTVNTNFPVLTIRNFNAGQTATLEVTGTVPGGLVGYAYSLTGVGPTSFSVPGCGAMDLALSNPVTVLGTTTSNPIGVASISASLPAGISGMTVWVQAVDLAACLLSNGATMIVG